MKILLSALLFAGLASANTSFELSYAGGSYSAGSGSTATTITLSPVDETLSYGFNTLNDIGTVIFPEDPDDTPWDVGSLDITFGSIEVTNELYSLVQPSALPGDLNFSLQMGSIHLGGPLDETLIFRFVPVVGLPGSTEEFALQANILSSTPEPGTLPMMLSGLAVLAGWLYLLRRKERRRVSA